LLTWGTVRLGPPRSARVAGFTFPFAAAATYGVRWRAVEHVRGGTGVGYAIVGVLTTGFALLAARSDLGLMKGTSCDRHWR
jgi:type IV secretory pathway VirB2 component (pilin)